MQRRKILLATTHIDRHNERLTYEALESIVEQINRSYIQVGVEHDPRIPPQGRVVSAELVQLEDGEYGVEAVVDLFEANIDVATMDTDREIKIPIYTGDKVHLVFDRRYLLDEESQKIIREIQEQAQVDVSEEGKKSLDPLSVLVIGLGVAAGRFFSGMLEKAGGDTWDYFKNRIALLLQRRRAERKEYLLSFRFSISEPNQQRLVEVILSNPTSRDIEDFFDTGLKRIDEVVPSLLRANPSVKKVVLEYKEGQIGILFGVRRDGAPMVFRFQ